MRSMMNFTIEIEREEDGRWLAEVMELAGVLAYGQTQSEAIAIVQALAFRVLAFAAGTWRSYPRVNDCFLRIYKHMDVATINLPPSLELSIELTDEQFFGLCQNHRDYRFERTASGELIIMPPTGSDTGRRNMGVGAQLYLWNRQNNVGVVFDSSSGFKLPNGADRSPDASWVRRERWEALTSEQQEKFAPLCPDFVVELRSPSDSLEKVREKMREYMDNGARLGWLINPQSKQVEIYRPDRDVEILQSPATLSGEDVLPGFVLDLKGIL